MKNVPQSIWPVSVFGLGFLLIIMGLSGVASIQETRRIHQQILAVEDTYRHIENVVESIRSDTSRVAVLRRDRLLERDASPSAYAVQLAALRAKTELKPGATEVAAAAAQQPARGAVGDCAGSLSEDRGAMSSSKLRRKPERSSWTMASARRPCRFLLSPKSWGS